MCEAVIDLTGILRRAYNDRCSVQLEQQWVSLMHPNFGAKPQGRLQISLDVLTASDALARPAGKGRDPPNQHPFLPEPVRPDTSFNPFRIDKW